MGTAPALDMDTAPQLTTAPQVTTPVLVTALVTALVVTTVTHTVNLTMPTMIITRLNQVTDLMTRATAMVEPDMEQPTIRATRSLTHGHMIKAIPTAVSNTNTTLASLLATIPTTTMATLLATLPATLPATTTMATLLATLATLAT